MATGPLYRNDMHYVKGRAKDETQDIFRIKHGRIHISPKT